MSDTNRSVPGAPTPPVPANPDVPTIEAAIEANVAARRQRGEYPPDLEQRLDEQWRRVVGQRAPQWTDDELRPRVEGLGSAMHFDAARIGTSEAESDGMIAARVHQLVNRATARQVNGVLDQVREFAVAAQDLLRGVTDWTVTSMADLRSQVDTANERLASYERATGGPNAGDPVSGLELWRRIEHLERSLGSLDISARAWSRAEAVEMSEVLDPIDEQLIERAAIRLAAGHRSVLIGAAPWVLCSSLNARVPLTPIRVIEPDAGVAATLASTLTIGDALDLQLGDPTLLLAQFTIETCSTIALVEGLERYDTGPLLALLGAAARALEPSGTLTLIGLDPESIDAVLRQFSLDGSRVRLHHPRFLERVLRRMGFIDVIWTSDGRPRWELVATKGAT